MDTQAQGMDDISPEELAKVLSHAHRCGEFTPDELLGNAHAWPAHTALD